MASSSTPKTSGAPTAPDKKARTVKRTKPATPAAKAPTAKPSLTKAQLTKAAKLRDEGATWNQLRAEFGVKLNSSRWFRAWEREGIEHTPAGQRTLPAVTTSEKE